MEFGICHLSVVPMRAEASDKAEIVNQILFGETFKILHKEDSWIKIQLDWDEYEGWVDSKQFISIDSKLHKKYLEVESAYCFELCSTAIGNNHYLPLTLGARLPSFDGLHFKFLKEKLLFNGKNIKPNDIQVNDKIIEKCATKYLNAPYLWGGKSPFGIDCSGFTQMVFKMLGKRILRDAYQQAQMGESVDFILTTKIGDLAFFGNSDNKITHVGIILGNNKIIHAHGKVRIDNIDGYGIYDAERKKYSHQLKLIKRIL